MRGSPAGCLCSTTVARPDASAGRWRPPLNSGAPGPPPPSDTGRAGHRAAVEDSCADDSVVQRGDARDDAVDQVLSDIHLRQCFDQQLRDAGDVRRSYPWWGIMDPVIGSFGSRGTEDIFNGIDSRSARTTCSPSVWRVAVRKLDQLNRVNLLTDLRIPPGNRLERLTGDRAGQFSIRINDQFRILFAWENGDARDVEIVDYH